MTSFEVQSDEKNSEEVKEEKKENQDSCKEIGVVQVPLTTRWQRLEPLANAER